MYELTQYKICSPFVYVDTLWLLNCMRKYFDKGDMGRFLFEIYFKTPCFAAAFKDFLDVEVCNAGEAIRSVKSIKKNVLNLKDSDEIVLKIFEELKRRKYLWYSIEYASNGEKMIHYILLDYFVGETIIFEKIDEKKDDKIPFKVKTSKWTRKGSYNPQTKEVTIEKIPIFEIEIIERKSIYNAKPDEVIPVFRNVFRRRVNLNHSDSVEKILFQNSADFSNLFFCEGEEMTNEIPLDDGEAFLDLLSCIVCYDIENPVSFFAPAVTVNNEIIFSNNFFSERWHWYDEERVRLFFEKVKDVFVKKEILNGEGFVVLIKIPEMHKTPVFPGNGNFDNVFEKIMPSHIKDKPTLKTYINNNVYEFVQSYFYLGSLYPRGNGRSSFDEYIIQQYKEKRKRN